MTEHTNYTDAAALYGLLVAAAHDDGDHRGGCPAEAFLDALVADLDDGTARIGPRARDVLLHGTRP